MACAEPTPSLGPRTPRSNESVTPPTATSSASQSFIKFEYIYDIPQMDKKRLSVILDQDEKWISLGKNQMRYSLSDLQDIQRCCAHRNRSPAEELLDKWGNLNHTIVELFVVLSQEKLYDGMEIIKRFVEPRYHVLLRPAQETRTLHAEIGSASTNDGNNNPADNKELNGPAGQLPQTAVTRSDENNASVSPGTGSDMFVQQDYRRPTTSSGRMADDLATLAGLIPKISYEELALATENWSEKYILGKGGFGTVYWGRFKYTQIAIKRIHHNKANTTESERIQRQQSINELKYLNSCRHDNILPLFGYSTGKEPCLVYQYMPGGSLDKRLFAKQPSPPLAWKDRVDIARGTARGLQYLHTFSSKPFIHGDIKPGNILLNECNQPRIGDFGLTREGSDRSGSMQVSRVYGTRPYIPHEFYTHKELSTKVDTYSFGVMLYEIATGLRAWDEKRTEKHLKDYITKAIRESVHASELIDKSNPITNDALNCCYNLLMLGRACTNDDHRQRPEMVAVLLHLEKPPKPTNT